MKLYRDNKARKAKLPKLKYKNIALTASILLTFLGSGFIKVIEDKEVDVPKGIVFRGNSSNGYFEYANTDLEGITFPIKDKLKLVILNFKVLLLYI